MAVAGRAPERAWRLLLRAGAVVFFGLILAERPPGSRCGADDAPMSVVGPIGGAYP